MLQRLTALELVKAGNASGNILNEIRPVIYSWYSIEEITKKVYSDIMNSIKLLKRMDLLYLNSERLLLEAIK